jgi:hypothetical protein
MVRVKQPCPSRQLFVESNKRRRSIFEVYDFEEFNEQPVLETREDVWRFLAANQAGTKGSRIVLRNFWNRRIEGVLSEVEMTGPLPEVVLACANGVEERVSAAFVKLSVLNGRWHMM